MKNKQNDKQCITEEESKVQLEVQTKENMKVKLEQEFAQAILPIAKKHNLYIDRLGDLYLCTPEIYKEYNKERDFPLYTNNSWDCLGGVIKYFVNGRPEIWWIKEDSCMGDYGPVRGGSGMQDGSVEAFVYQVEQDIEKELPRIKEKVRLMHSTSYYESRIDQILMHELLDLTKQFPEITTAAPKLKERILKQIRELNAEFNFKACSQEEVK